MSPFGCWVLQPPTKKNGKVTTLKSKAQELGFAFKSGNLTILLGGCSLDIKS